MKSSTFRSGVIGFLLVLLGWVGGYRVGYADTLHPLLKSVMGPVVGRSVRQQQSLDSLSSAQKADLDLFWQVWNLLELEYLDQDKLVADDMVEGAIAGMTAALDDPYTAYLPKKQNQRSGEELAGAFYGVGIELGYVDETLAVVAPLKGTPAAAAGVEAGDLILHVTDEAKGLDEDTVGWTLTQAVENIRGPKNTDVELTLFRDNNGHEPFEVAVTRGEIVIESVVLEYVEHAGKRVAHLSVARFGERTQAEWNAAVRSILSQQTAIDGVVLDLRNNPGGFLKGAVDLAGEFISSGVVVTEQGRVKSRDYKAKGDKRLVNVPVIILVNKGSASASEILAGALREQVGAKLVGSKTFGKGTIQDRRELPNEAGIHITIGRWLLPNGEWIHKEGLNVDVEVENDRETEADEVLLRGIEEL